MEPSPARALLLDIGGVILTKGWDRHARRRAAERFKYDHDEVEDRHEIVVHTYEEGDMTLDQYLDDVVFFKQRGFLRDDYKTFMFSQSKPYPDMLQLFAELKARRGIKIIALSNEGRELALHRVRSFDLAQFIDFFVVSSFVHCRKPDPRIFHMALDQVLLPLDAVVYIDDTLLHVEVARGLGIPAIHHVDRETTAAALSERWDYPMERPHHAGSG
jgi:putative hydrolase of the HAD superfamily